VAQKTEARVLLAPIFETVEVNSLCMLCVN